MAVGLLPAFLILCGCTDVPNLPPAPKPAQTAYLVQPGDTLDIKFQYNPELDDQPTVAPDGRISLLYAPDLRVGGKTTDQVRQEIDLAYAQQLIKPAVTVAIKGAVDWRIYVGGEVTQPNEYTGTGPAPTLSHVIAMAGGLKDTGDGSKVVVSRRVDGKRVSYLAKYTKVAKGKAPARDAELASGDTLYVPKTGVADVYTAFNQYVLKFIPSNLRTSYGIFGTAASTTTPGTTTTGPTANPTPPPTPTPTQ
jgi:protein involved in polysaccharide export with SLBB domain